MTIETIDKLFWATLLLIILMGVGSIYWIIKAESWWGRAGIFFGMGGLLYFLFMMAVFGFAAWGNNLDRAQRSPQAIDASATTQPHSQPDESSK